MRVEANFKEVSAHSHADRTAVNIEPDLYGAHVEYRGTIAGLGLGTGRGIRAVAGAKCHGNWIKGRTARARPHCPRPQQVAAHPLRIGLSTHAVVDVRDDSGSQLAQAPRKEPVLNRTSTPSTMSEIGARIAQIVADNPLPRRPKPGAPKVVRPGPRSPGPPRA